MPPGWKEFVVVPPRAHRDRAGAGDQRSSPLARPGNLACPKDKPTRRAPPDAPAQRAHTRNGRRRQPLRRRLNWSATQRPGAVSAIHSGFLMAVSSRDCGRVNRTGVPSLTDRSPVRTTTTPAIRALPRSRRITYRLTGSPTKRITGESAMITGHVASVIAARAPRHGCLGFISQA
jgi:hypothetical protein